MFFVKHKYKNKLFAVIPNKENAASFQTHGLSLLVLFEDEFEVRGIRFFPDGNANFTAHKDDWGKLIEEGVIEEIVDEENKKTPKYMITTFKKQYKKNLQQ